MGFFFDLTYALGRGLGSYDAPTVRAIVREAKRQDYRFTSGLIVGGAGHEIVRFLEDAYNALRPGGRFVVNLAALEIELSDEEFETLRVAR